MENSEDGIGPVEITVQRGLAVVRPGCRDILAPLLSYPDVSFDPNETGRIGHREVTSCCFQQLSDDRLLIPAGCVQRVVECLQDHASHIYLRDLRRADPRQHCVDVRHCLDADRRNPGYSEAVRASTEGIIEVANWEQRFQLTAELCRIFPQARILVASVRPDTVQEVMAALLSVMGGEVAAVCGRDWHSSCRVVSCTMASLDSADPADWDILVLLDAEESLGKATTDARARFGFAFGYRDNWLTTDPGQVLPELGSVVSFDLRRVYAFTSPDPSLSDKQQLQFETLAGPVIHRASRNLGPQPVSPTALFASYASAACEVSQSPREQRETLWASEPRNHAIAAVARGISEANRDQLWAHGLFVDDDSVPQPNLPCGVTILVDSVTHASQLSPLLPGWPVVHVQPDCDGVEPPHDSRPRPMVPINAIVTACAAVRYHNFAAQVVLNAAGGRRPLVNALGRLPAPSFVIDFDDDQSGVWAEHTQQRRQAYRSSGFQMTEPDSQTAGPVVETNGRRGSRRRSSNTSRRRNRQRRPQRN